MLIDDRIPTEPIITPLRSLGWSYRGCSADQLEPIGALGPDSQNSVVLAANLHAALRKFNPELSGEDLAAAALALTQDRSAQTLVAANRAIHTLLKHGIPPPTRSGETKNLRVIDWDVPANNEFLLAGQFPLSAEPDIRQAYLVGFVNGLPLLLFRLASACEQPCDVFTAVSADQARLPQLFWYNAFTLLVGPGEIRLGTITTPFELFREWKHLSEPGAQTIARSPFPDIVPSAVSVSPTFFSSRPVPPSTPQPGKMPAREITLRATCDPIRLLDLVENFVQFCDLPTGPVKFLAMNHQQLGVNRAFEALPQLKRNRGRLGICWHAPGTGKTLSMIFFVQKVMRKLPGARSFVIVTDRPELVEQLRRDFVQCGVSAADQGNVPGNGDDLKRMLATDCPLIFAPLRVFTMAPVGKQPVLSERANVIVLADEIHRVQYDDLPLNLKQALPNAAFLAFTGTPLVTGEEKTRRIFGEYVSVCNYRQAVGDTATLPLYFDMRRPELQLPSIELSEELTRLLEDAEQDESQESRLPREFERLYQLVTRDERQEAIARDIVAHFISRGVMGKAMVAGIDRVTTARLYERVRRCWHETLAGLREHARIAMSTERAELDAKAAWMAETSMALIGGDSEPPAVDQRPGIGDRGSGIGPDTRNPIPDTGVLGVPISDAVPHSALVTQHSALLQSRFADPANPLRIVFVTTRWTAGLDVPSCSTIYLDRPMRNHALMQLIARTSRVYGSKACGIVVDYLGVFQNPARMLATFAGAPRSGIMVGDLPVEPKTVLIQRLKSHLQNLTDICRDLGLEIDILRGASAFEVAPLVTAATEAILGSVETRLPFLDQADQMNRCFLAMLPDPAAQESRLARDLFLMIAARLRSLRPSATHGLEDVGTLQKQFLSGSKQASAERLRWVLRGVLAEMIRRDPGREPFRARLQQLVSDHRVGTTTLEWYFGQLVDLARELQGLPAEPRTE